MTIERQTEDILLINGVDVEYEAEFMDVVDEDDHPYLNNGEVEVETTSHTGKVVDWIKFNPVQSRDVEDAVIEFLNDGK